MERSSTSLLSISHLVRHYICPILLLTAEVWWYAAGSSSSHKSGRKLFSIPLLRSRSDREDLIHKRFQLLLDFVRACFLFSISINAKKTVIVEHGYSFHTSPFSWTVNPKTKRQKNLLLRVERSIEWRNVGRPMITFNIDSNTSWRIFALDHD